MNIFIAEIQDNKAKLTAEESWHCAKVLRMRAGQAVRLIDGAGNYFDAVLESVHEKQCVASVTSEPVQQAKRNYFLHVAIAPTKQIDRIEWMVEKCVEIGVDKISLIVCKNSERKTVNTDRLRKIAVSAVKQSLQAFIPEIGEAVSFAQFITENKETQKLIAHCGDTVKREISETVFKNKTTLVLIGPEGDFAPEEVDAATTAGFEALSLGSTRLRTETAGLYVCQAASILSQK